MCRSNQSAIVLQGRIILKCPNHPSEDLSDDQFTGFERLVFDGTVAQETVERCERRLFLIRTALMGRKSIQTAPVLAVLDDALLDLAEDSALRDFVTRCTDYWRKADVMPLPPISNEETSNLRVLK